MRVRIRSIAFAKTERYERQQRVVERNEECATKQRKAHNSPRHTPDARGFKPLGQGSAHLAYISVQQTAREPHEGIRHVSKRAFY